MNQSEIVIGALYRHYKGKLYKVLDMARHSETHEIMVIYQALYDDQRFGHQALWVRPVSLFLEDVEVNGIKMPRFVRQENSL